MLKNDPESIARQNLTDEHDIETHRVDTEAAHDVDWHVVEVAAIDEKLALHVHWGHEAHNGHAGAHQLPQQPLLVHARLPAAEVRGHAEKAARMSHNQLSIILP